ncbi:non-ribosomal peptide synthetase [Chryseobacterium sp. BIGb0232]|uniref:non-ribosomal peptide synthetase n=1 Tax=Chryseobacterium sp. BIGb0232 TaxID=2940598 RepID=UPI000F498737|nr:non-ribosomal peptide synthetase [Chryseobacterium sp. BIGb0232]MCS4300957.1 pyochelin synthetase [Chryseobacterium sp. BIGb0232]ROS20177.1 pyochelin synthetase [Chryseobacterium nakagawai]
MNTHMTTYIESVDVQELMNSMRKKKIQLWTEDGKLKFKAPKGVMEPNDLELLKENKEKILDYLESENKTMTIQNDLPNRYKPFPLTDVQSAYLLGRNPGFRYGGVACHLYMELKYNALDHKLVENTWNRLVQRHEMLRATVSNQGFQSIQQETPRFTVSYQDVSSLAIQEQASVLEKVRGQMSHRVYDTEQWPLFDIAVTTTQWEQKKESVLHFSMEFLIADWISMWMLMAEFETLYFNPDIQLSPLSLSFRDYAIAERGIRETPAYAKDRNYWMNRVETLPAGPTLPVSRRENTASNHFTRNSTLIEKKKWESFKATANSHGITPTSAVAAVYAYVLERWSETDHFCLNLTVLNRMPLHPEVHQIVGDFTSVSLLEVDYREPKVFSETAKNMNIQLFDDLDHPLFTGVEVLREMTKKQQNGRVLLPVVLTSAIGLLDTGEDAGLKGQIGDYNISQTPQVFIDCQVVDTAQGLSVNWDTRDGIFPEQMIDDMFSTFETLLNELSDHPESWHKKDLITLPSRHQEERDQLNHEPAMLPESLLHEPTFKNFKKNADKTAIVDEYGSFTYQDIEEKTAAIALQLQQLGCKEQDKVAITLPKSHHQVTSVLAVLALGGVYVPIDLNQPVERRTKIIKNAGIKYVLTSDEISQQGYGTENGVHIIAVDTLQHDKETGLDTISAHTKQDCNAPAYVIYTSGSTGEPKGVMISHLGAMNTIEDINRRFNIDEKDSVLALSQLGFDLSVYDIFGMLGLGGTLIYPNPDRQRDPSHWLELMQNYQITVWNTAPALMQMFVNFLETEKQEIRTSLSHFRLALLSGDWIPLNLPDTLKQLVPSVQLISLGGATEASIWSNFHMYKGLQPDWNSIPYGRPLSNQGFRILDEQMRDCPEWKSGDLFITGSGLALEYFNDPDLTDERFFLHPSDGERMYKTGDLGRYMPGGEIEFLGRRDKQVKIRGHRIELGEIESALTTHPDVSNAVVIAKTHTENSKIKTLFGFIVPSGNQSDSDFTSEIVQFLGKKVPAYMVPSHLQVIDRIPVTVNGKVDIKKLEELCILDTGKTTTGNQDFTDELEKTIHDLWCSSLGLDYIDKHQNLNDFGADSLISAQMAGKLRDIFVEKGQQHLTFDLILRQILTSPTIADLADFFRDQENNAGVQKKAEETKKETRIGTLTHFGGDSSGMHRIILHAGGGTLERYKHLIREMVNQNSGAVYGISVGDFDAYCAIESDQLVERISDDYCASIIENGAKQVQLIGYSIGSMIAVEMARRLSEKGIEVADLCIIDAIRVPFKVYDDLFVEFRFLPNLGINPADAGFGEMNGKLFMEWVTQTLQQNKNELPEGAIFTMQGNSELVQISSVFNKMKAASQSERFDAYLDAMKRLSGREMPKELLERTYRTFAQNFKASRFVSPPYFGDIRYFKAKDQGTTTATGINDDIVELWSEISLGTLDITDIEGDHLGCVGEEYTPDLARHLEISDQ